MRECMCAVLCKMYPLNHGNISRIDRKDARKKARLSFMRIVKIYIYEYVYVCVCVKRGN